MKLPDSVGFNVACWLAGTTGVALNAVRDVARVRLGDAVLVTGHVGKLAGAVEVDEAERARREQRHPHRGVHPRLGAVDVVPFVALAPTAASTAVEAALMGRAVVAIVTNPAEDAWLPLIAGGRIAVARDAESVRADHHARVVHEPRRRSMRPGTVITLGLLMAAILLAALLQFVFHLG